MLFYKYGILYIILGFLLFLSTPFLLNIFNDNGVQQRKVLRLISLFFVIIGIIFTIVKVNVMLSIFIVTIGPWVIYGLFQKNI